MRKQLLLLLALGTAVSGLFAQTRYIDDIYARNEVVVSNNEVYGQNYYFLNYPPAPQGTNFGNPQIADLQMDVYTPPASDATTDRGLIVYLHTGSFLPKYLNQTTTGKKDDSAVVEMCTRLAMKGYVVAAINYRLGWNPLAPTLTERTEGILNAVYRAIHDAQTCVRYFKTEAANYKIDPDRIIVMGQGSGGYVSLAYGYLNRVEETYLPKFLNLQGASVVDTNVVGNISGWGGVYNVYNHFGVSNKVAMVCNIGGAMGDISWMEGTYPDVPVASMHCRDDYFAPYDSGIVIVPATGQPVVFVHGSRTVVNKAVGLGLNDIWVNHNFTDDYSTRAYALNPKNTSEGLFEFVVPEVPGPFEEGSPWEWWDSTTVAAECAPFGINGGTIHTNSVASNPTMSKMKAIAYIDTVLGFMTPRMYLAMTAPDVGVEESSADIALTLAPNPGTGPLTLQVAEGNSMKGLRIFTLEGKLVFSAQGSFGSTYTWDAKDIPAGVYHVQIHTALGIVTKKWVKQ